MSDINNSPTNTENDHESIDRIPRDPKTLLRSAAGILSFLVFAGVIGFFIYYVYENTGFACKYSSVLLYMNYAWNTVSGMIPYHDFTLEYPPLSLLFFILPTFFVENFSGNYALDFNQYSSAYTALVFLFCLAGLALTGLIAKKFNRSPVLLMLVFTACLCAIGPIFPKWYDIYVTILTLASVYFYFTHHRNIAWFLLALATLTKLYPILLAPVFLIPYLIDMIPYFKTVIRNKSSKKPEIEQEFEPEIEQEFELEIEQEFEPEIEQELEPKIEQEKETGEQIDECAKSDAEARKMFTASLKKAILGFAVFALTGIIICLPFMAYDFSGFMSFLTYHTERGVQIESLLSSIAFLGHNHGIEMFSDLSLVANYGSTNLDVEFINEIGKYLTPLMLLVVAFIYVFFTAVVLKRTLFDGKFKTSAEFINVPENARLFAMTCFLIITAFIIVGKIFSPQYIIWLFPFVPMAFLGGKFRYGNFGNSKTSETFGNSVRQCLNTFGKNIFTAENILAVFFFGCFISIALMTFYIFPTHYTDLYNFRDDVVNALFARNVRVLIMGLIALILCRKSFCPCPSKEDNSE